MILEESVYKDTLDKWFKYDISSHENKHTSILQAYILLVGSSTGMLTRLNLFNGGDEFNTVAHDCEIFRIISHSRNQQILTCSFEGIIKIWRVYPHVHECLLQVTAFELISAPSFIIASKKRICFAINYADQAINTIEMFDTQTLNKYTHTCHNDHHDTIVDLAVCSSIGIFVSVGMDETVRFWDENNALLSVLSIYCCPSCICFSNERGDVFIALAEQIFLIEAQIFIPDFISNTLLGISLLESNMEVISLFYGPLDQMTSIGLQKLKVIDNRNQSQIFQIQQDSEERESLPNIRTNEHYYFNRNSGMKYDLEMLIGCTNCLQRVGKITAIQSVNIMESWNKYYGMYFSPPYEMNIKFDDKLIGNNQLDEGTYIKEFSKASSNNFFHRRDDMIFKCGFVPNSMYLENSYLEKSTITDSSIFDINKHLFQSNDKSKDNFNKHNSLENSLLGDNIISKFEEKSQYHIENIPEQSEDIDQHLSPSPTILSITNQRKGNLFGHETSIKLINKKIAKSSDKPILRNDHNQSCTSIQNTLLPLSTPFIPRILEQFLSEKWFKDLFPDLNSKTFPTNCSLSSCYSIIFSTCSHTLDNLFSTIEALQSIILLDKLSCFSGSDKEDIFDIIIDKLLCPAKPIIFLNNKEFKFASLKVLNKFCFSNSMKYVSYLLTEFLLGDFETRHIILDYLKSYGLSDPFKYLSRELDSWNMVAFSTSLEKPKLLKYTMDWLQELIMSIRNSTNSFTLMTKQYPSCIDALNLLVKRNTVLELQSGLNVSKPRSPSPPDNFKLKHQLKSVVTLPEICFSQKIIRMGETHNSECHNERETTLVNYTNSPFLGILKNDTSKNILLHLPVQHQNLTLSQSNQSRIIVERLQQKRKYFLLTQSQLI